jgi:hypothetical protein
VATSARFRPGAGHRSGLGEGIEGRPEPAPLKAAHGATRPAACGLDERSDCHWRWGINIDAHLDHKPSPPPSPSIAGK